MQKPKTKDKMSPSIEFSNENIKKVEVIFNTLLMHEYNLYSKTRNANWNTGGKYFKELHKFVENKFCQTDYVEKVILPGYYTLKFSGNNRKTWVGFNQESEFNSQNVVIQKLIKDHESLINSINKEISIIIYDFKDSCTADFIPGLIMHYEKLEWALGAFLQLAAYKIEFI